jgi:hypothetical protein
MLDKLKEIHQKFHEHGIKLWYLRDPLKGVPSVSLTLLIISFNLYIFSLINKFAKWFSDVDGVGQLLIITAGLYFGRSFSTKSGSSEAPSDKQE